MSPTIYDLGIDKLSVADRVRLRDEIQRTLDAADPVPLSDAHWREIEDRLDHADANPGVGFTWEEVMTRLLARR